MSIFVVVGCGSSDDVSASTKPYIKNINSDPPPGMKARQGFFQKMQNGGHATTTGGGGGAAGG